MRWGVALTVFAICVWASAARADAGLCGPGCHTAVNGGCVVDGWEAGAPVRNECPAGAHPRPPCDRPYVWRKQAKACVNVN